MAFFSQRSFGQKCDWVTSKYRLSKVYFAKLFAWGSRGVNIVTKFKQFFRHFSWNSIFSLLLFRTTSAVQILPIFLQSIMLLVALNCRKPFFFFFIWTENNNLERTNIFFSFSISEMSATSLTQLKQFYSSRLYHPRKSSSQPSIYPPTSFTIVFAKGCTDGSSERTKCNAVYKRRWMWILSISKSNKAYDFYCMWESFGQCNTD